MGLCLVLPITHQASSVLSHCYLIREVLEGDQLIIMGLGEECKDQATRSKGIFSSSFTVSLGGGGGGDGYPAHNAPHYPVNGYPAPAPPPGAYPGCGGHHQPGYNHHSPPHHVPNPAYGGYPNSYGGHGGGGYGGYQHQYQHQQHQQQHQQQHVDYYHRREEINMYQQQQGPYGGKYQFGIRRGISDAKV